MAGIDPYRISTAFPFFRNQITQKYGRSFSTPAHIVFQHYAPRQKKLTLFLETWERVGHT
jgi:hypothetical protein